MNRWERLGDGLTVWKSGPLPRSFLDALSRQLPSIDIEAVEDAVDAYELVGVLGVSNPKGDRDALKQISNLAGQLIYSLQTMSPEGRSQLDSEMQAVGVGARLKSCRRELSALCSGAVGAHARIVVSKGRPETIKTQLVATLARIIDDAGLDVNAKKNGPLVYLTSEILGRLGDQCDYRSLVRNSLAKKGVDR